MFKKKEKKQRWLKNAFERGQGKAKVSAIVFLGKYIQYMMEKSSINARE